jgi:hypothetical protein
VKYTVLKVPTPQRDAVNRRLIEWHVVDSAKSDVVLGVFPLMPTGPPEAEKAVQEYVQERIEQEGDEEVRTTQDQSKGMGSL